LEGPAASLLGANQHMTSKLQQKVLTQQVQVRGVHLRLRCVCDGCCVLCFAGSQR
jgi:hypothetical protein